MAYIKETIANNIREVQSLCINGACLVNKTLTDWPYATKSYYSRGSPTLTICQSKKKPVVLWTGLN